MDRRMTLMGIEYQLRNKIYTGAIPMWEAAQARFDHLYATEVKALKIVNKVLKDKIRKMEMDELVKKHQGPQISEVPTMSIITGGNDGGDNVEPFNWLSELPVGTYFLCRERKTDPRNPMLSEFKVEWHGEKSSKLLQTGPNGDQLEIVVDTIRFSRHMEKFEIE